MNSFTKLTVALSLALIISANAFSSDSGELTVGDERVAYNVRAEFVDPDLQIDVVRTDPADNADYRNRTKLTYEVSIHLKGDGKLSTIDETAETKLSDLIDSACASRAGSVKILNIYSDDETKRMMSNELIKRLFKNYENLETIRVGNPGLRQGRFLERTDFKAELD